MALNRKSSGFITIPMLLLVLALVAMGFGTLAFLHQWKGMMRAQLAVDRCVGLRAQAARDRMNRLERGNAEIRATRAALAPSTLAPPARAALQAVLEALVLAQEWERLQWTREQLQWSAGLACVEDGLARGSPLNPDAYPAFPWRRDPPDSLGSQPLVRKDVERHGFSLQLTRQRARRRLRARAQVFEDRAGDPFAPLLSPWEARWEFAR